MIQRNSVPQGHLTEQQIETFLIELMKNSRPWRTMKLIILGHGHIGKTTLLAAFKNLMDPSFHYEVCTLRRGKVCSYFVLDGRYYKHSWC